MGAGLTALAAVAWAQLSVKPGQYEVNIEMQLPGAPAPQSMQTADCLAPEDAQDLAKAILRELAGDSSCSASNQQTTGNKLSLDVTCTVDGRQVTSTVVVTVLSSESYSAVMDVNLQPGVVMSTRMTGKWSSAQCSAEALEE
jgi:hypothetical protein